MRQTAGPVTEPAFLFEKGEDAVYQDFGRTRLGAVRVDTQAIVSLVARRLPVGVQCTAVRLRAHDRLCLVVISDRREFWSREDDQRRARAIADDLRALGMDMPRIQWIRQTRYLDEHPLYAEHPLYGLPVFWMNVAGGLFAVCAFSWRVFVAYVAVQCAAWLASSWLLSGGWYKIERALPFLKNRHGAES